MIGKYYTKHTKVVFSSNSTIKDLVNTKALKDWNMNEIHPEDCKCNEIDVQHLFTRLQFMYRPQLKVILKEYSSDYIQFLEYYCYKRG